METAQSPPIVRDTLGFPPSAHLAGMDAEVFSDPKLLAEHLAIAAEALPRPPEKTGKNERLRRRMEDREEHLRIERERLDYADLIVRMEKTGVYRSAGYETAEAFLMKLGRTWPGDEDATAVERTLRDYKSTVKHIPGEKARLCLVSIKVYAVVAQVPSDLCRAMLCDAIEEGARPKALRCAARVAKTALRKGRSEKRARAEAADALEMEPVSREERTAVAVAKAIRLLDKGRKSDRPAPRPSVEPAATDEIGKLKEGLAELGQEVRTIVQQFQGPQWDPRRYYRGPGEPVAEPVPQVVPDAGPAAPPAASTATVATATEAPPPPAAEPVAESVPMQTSHAAPDPAPKDESPSSSEDELPVPEAPPVPESAPRPERVYPHQHFLGVGFPYEAYDLTPNERNACNLITVATWICRWGKLVVDLAHHPDQFKHFDDRLQLHVARAAIDARMNVDRFLPALKELGAQGLAIMEAECREEGRDPADYPAPVVDTFVPAHFLSKLPLDVLDETPLAQGYLTLDVVEPYACDNFKEPSDLRLRVYYFLALLKVLRQSQLDFEESNQDPEQALYPELAYQLEQALRDVEGHLSRVTGNCMQRGKRAIPNEHEWAEEEKKVEEAKKAAEARIIIVGEDQMPRQHGKLGMMINGRHVGITLTVAQVLIACGLQGTGKTQGAVLLREMLHLMMPGLNVRQEPAKSISFEVDFNRGETRRCSLSGIYPNPYPAHRQQLKDRFNFSQLISFPKIDVLVLPKMGEHYRREFQEIYGEEHERFNIFEAGLDAEEMGSLFYRLMLPIGTRGDRKAHTQGRSLIEAIIGNLGVGCPPERILAEFVKAKFPGVNQTAFRAQFDLIQKLHTPGQFMIDRLKSPYPLVTLMESRVLGPDRLLSLEVAFMAALSEVLRDGSNPLRYFFMHELGKQALHEVIAPYLLERTAEVRHNVCSYYLETQQAAWLPKSLVALCTGVLQCKTTSQVDYRILQELFYAFQHVPFHQVAELVAGWAYMGFHNCNDPQFRDRAFLANLRASATWAGGETVAVV